MPKITEHQKKLMAYDPKGQSTARNISQLQMIRDEIMRVQTARSTEHTHSHKHVHASHALKNNTHDRT